MFNIFVAFLSRILFSNFFLHYSYESTLSTMERESEDSSNNLLIRLQLFHDWILFAKQQLQFVGADQGERSFSDLLQKEQGLKVGAINKMYKVKLFSLSQLLCIWNIS